MNDYRINTWTALDLKDPSNRLWIFDMRTKPVYRLGWKCDQASIADDTCGLFDSLDTEGISYPGNGQSILSKQTLTIDFYLPDKTYSLFA
jgi:hypothetical protein